VGLGLYIVGGRWPARQLALASEHMRAALRTGVRQSQTTALTIWVNPGLYIA
jgi:hypothetical protein